MQTRLVVRLLLALLVTGCGYSVEISIHPSDDVPLGVGLTERYVVDETICDDGDPGPCDPNGPTDLQITVKSGDAARVETVGWQTFALTGIAPGETTFRVATGDAAPVPFTVTTSPVGATQISVPRMRSNSVPYPPAESPVAAFINASIAIDQTSTAPDGTAVAGHAALEVTPGATHVSVDPTSDFVATGDVPGSAQLVAPAGVLELHVVDLTAIAKLWIDDEPGEQLHLVVSSATVDLDMFPFDASGHPIVGAGPEPAVTVGEPSLLSVYADDAAGNLRRLTVQARDVGTTTLAIRWGTFATTFTVSITSFGV